MVFITYQYLKNLYELRRALPVARLIGYLESRLPWLKSAPPGR